MNEVRITATTDGEKETTIVLKHDFELDAARSRMLNETKKQSEPGAMRPRLYQVLEEHGEKPSELKLQWLFYAGMGDTALGNLRDDKHKQATRNLMSDGILVPTSIEDYYGIAQIQRLTHFDDVNWATNADGKLIIYKLTDFDNCPDWPDDIIIPDETHDAAIDYLRKQTEYGKTMEDMPLTLRDGSQITPILTNRELIEYRKRQQNTPSA